MIRRGRWMFISGIVFEFGLFVVGKLLGGLLGTVGVGDPPGAGAGGLVCANAPILNASTSEPRRKDWTVIGGYLPRTVIIAPVRVR
jgi:hypothetical protein